MTAIQVLRRLALTALLTCAVAPAHAQALRIVAVGASNTWGWGVRQGEAYPERLQVLLRQNGIDASVKNAGVNFSTTRGMLRRLDSVVADNINIVIIERGRNDIRFFSTPAKRAARVRTMVERLQARGIKSIVYEPPYASDDFQWDRIHLTAKAHDNIAVALLPRVLAAIPQKPPERPARKRRI